MIRKPQLYPQRILCVMVTSGGLRYHCMAFRRGQRTIWKCENCAVGIVGKFDGLKMDSNSCKICGASVDVIWEPDVEAARRLACSLSSYRLIKRRA